MRAIAATAAAAGCFAARLYKLQYSPVTQPVSVARTRLLGFIPFGSFPTATTRCFLSPSCPPPSNVSTVVPTTRYTIDCPATPLYKLEQRVTSHALRWDAYDRCKPIAPHNQQAFDEVWGRVELFASHPAAKIMRNSTPAPVNVILDSGCGTGRSTFHLGNLYPDHLVIGVYKSICRLSQRHWNKMDRTSHDNGHDNDEGTSDASSSWQSKACFAYQRENVIVLRAELVDFWRCWDRAVRSSRHSIALQQHYLLYPNPYPKASRLHQRWYGHASFPLLLLLHDCPLLVVRSNWFQYLLEFATAGQLANEIHNWQRSTTQMQSITGPTLLPRLREPQTTAWTNFEAKYHHIGEPTYEIRIHTFDAGSTSGL